MAITRTYIYGKDSDAIASSFIATYLKMSGWVSGEDRKMRPWALVQVQVWVGTGGENVRALDLKFFCQALRARRLAQTGGEYYWSIRAAII
jgi:hypothetical protein